MIGFFWDSKKKWLYILPIPCFGIIFKLNSFYLPDGYSFMSAYQTYNNYYTLFHNGNQIGAFKTKYAAIKYAHNNEKQLR